MSEVVFLVLFHASATIEQFLNVEIWPSLGGAGGSVLICGAGSHLVNHGLGLPSGPET